MALAVKGGGSGDTPGKRSTYWLCPTPKEYCQGTICSKPRCKVHSTPESVRKCQVNYLKKLGYKQLSPREFQLDDGPIMVINKKAMRGHPGKADRPMPQPHRSEGRW